jgi:O-methyltransferase
MQQLKWWLLKTHLYRLLVPLQWMHPKAKAFVNMCNWLQIQQFERVDFYNAHTTHKDHYKLFEYLTRNLATQSFDYFEFGVDDGESFRWWLQHLTNPSSRFFGFDSFEGLPEDWGKLKKGSFSHNGNMPVITDSRAQLIKGWFADTVPVFLTDYHPANKKLILMDADLYSSTITVLKAIAPYLQAGDFIMFDEFFAPQHEFKAWIEFLHTHSEIKYRAIAAFGNYQYVGFEIL